MGSMATVRAQINPKMLRFARVRAGASVEEAAEWAKVSAERYSAWEAGPVANEREKPTVRKLQVLAGRLKRPLVFFFLEHPPTGEIDPEEFKDFRTAGGEPAELGRWLRHALRSAAERRALVIELAEEAGFELPTFDLTCSLDDDPSEVARRVRHALGVTLENQRGLTEETAFTFWKRRVSQAVLVFEFDHVDVVEARGFALGDRPVPVIGVNGSDVAVARTFTLLHELGHVLLGEHAVISISSQTDVDAEERFCNRLAAAVLVPGDALLAEPEVRIATREETWPDARLHALARRYGVSRHAMLRRLLDLDKVSEERYWQQHREFLRQYEALKARQRREAKESPPRLSLPRRAMKTNGALFSRVVLDAQAAEKLTLWKAARILGVHPDQIDDMRVEVASAGG